MELQGGSQWSILKQSETFAIIGPILLGLLWVLKRIEKGQNQMIRKINKIDKHKVLYKVCDHHRGNCGGCSRNH